jgi:hypothetical protein
MFKASFRSGLETVIEQFEIIGQGEMQGHSKKETTMKKRRIEITVSRRRTTVILRDRSKVNNFERLPGDGERSYPVCAGEVEAAEIEPVKTEITNSGNQQLGLIRVKANDGKPN